MVLATGDGCLAAVDLGVSDIFKSPEYALNVI